MKNYDVPPIFVKWLFVWNLTLAMTDIVTMLDYTYNMNNYRMRTWLLCGIYSLKLWLVCLGLLAFPRNIPVSLPPERDPPVGRNIGPFILCPSGTLSTKTIVLQIHRQNRTSKEVRKFSPTLILGSQIITMHQFKKG